MRLMLLGSPGAGKGTQATFITEKFQIPQISTGDILRAAIRAGSELGLQVKKTMDEGKLISDETIIQIVKDRIQQPDCANGFILDGFPRTIPQAQALKDNGIDLDFVIEISVPDEELVARLSGRRVHPASGRSYHILYNPPKVADQDDLTGDPLIQRIDDSEETIRHRLSVYHDQTKPLIEYYQQAALKSSKPVYLKLNGMGSVSDITTKIFMALEAKATN
jgi:adenylate kinase